LAETRVTPQGKEEKKSDEAAVKLAANGLSVTNTNYPFSLTTALPGLMYSSMFHSGNGKSYILFNF
jgi:hypothetical protein